jgi:DHA1 family bicyclomycin/chloramphenicol resistance-like MFS transporter
LTPQISDRALLILLAAIAALGPIATNLYLPALPAVREHFGASVADVQATFSISLVSFAFGILAWGPIADRFGRRKAVLGGLGIMVSGALVSLFAQNLHWLVAGRGIQAFGTATGIVVARAILSDRYPIERMSRALAQVTMVAVTTNALAPVLGGFLTAGFGWRSVFAALVLAASGIGVFVWRRLPETRAATAHPPRGRDMAATAWSLVRMPMFAGCVLQSAVIYATFLVFISLAPYVMVSAFGRNTTEFGFYYLFIAAGYFLGNWSVGRFMAHHDLHWMVVTGVLVSAASAVLALGFVALGLTHPLWIFVPIAVLSYGQGLALPNVTATAVSLAPQHAGVASSTIGFLQQIIGAACVQWMGHFSTKTALPVMTFVAAVCVIGLALLYVFPRVEAGGRGPPPVNSSGNPDNAAP